MEARDRAIIAMTPTADHSDYRGYAVVASAGSAALVTTPATDDVLGVILDGEATTGQDSIAVCGGNAGPVKVKLSASPGTVVAGTRLVLDGTTLGAAKATAGGARVEFARALESGSANELIEAILVPTIVHAS